MSSFTEMLVNTVVIEKRSVSFNAVNEEITTYNDGDTIAASVQERTPTEAHLPDSDGPLFIDAVIFTPYRTDIEHLDRLRQTDVSPARVYRVLTPKDPAGRHHHLECEAQRVWRTDEEVGS